MILQAHACFPRGLHQASLAPFYRCGGWWPEGNSDLLKITQKASGRTGLEARASAGQGAASPQQRQPPHSGDGAAARAPATENRGWRRCDEGSAAEERHKNSQCLGRPAMGHITASHKLTHVLPQHPGTGAVILTCRRGKLRHKIEIISNRARIQIQALSLQCPKA